MKKSIMSLGLALGLTACAAPEVPKDVYYRLDVGAATAGTQRLNGVVEIERFRADGLISARALSYSETQGHLSTYHYHYWVEPPVDLLQAALIDYLRTAEIASHVVRPQLRMSEDFLITGHIKRLERDLSTDPAIRITLELGLKRTADDEILVLKTYERRLMQQGETVSGAIAAMQEALRDIYAEFLTDIRA